MPPPATASPAGTANGWRGIHVVTANKLGNGAYLARAQAVADAAREHGALYGDSATVGAGLPLLRSLRELVAGGDRIRSVEGVTRTVTSVVLSTAKEKLTLELDAGLADNAHGKKK